MYEMSGCSFHTLTNFDVMNSIRTNNILHKLTSWQLDTDRNVNDVSLYFNLVLSILLLLIFLFSSFLML